jgi:hypothetical protein
MKTHRWEDIRHGKAYDKIAAGLQAAINHVNGDTTGCVVHTFEDPVRVFDDSAKPLLPTRMEIKIMSPHGDLTVAGSSAAIGWLLQLGPPEGKKAKGKAGKAKAKGIRTRQTFTDEEKAKHLAQAKAAPTFAEYSKTSGVKYASLMNWKAATKKKKK